MATIEFTYTDHSESTEGSETDESGEVTEALPARWEICHICEGDGKHSRHMGAITESDRAQWSEEEIQGYFAGAYDIKCDDCKGMGKTLVLNVEAISDPDTKRDVKRQLRESRKLAKEQAHEIAMGY